MISGPLAYEATAPSDSKKFGFNLASHQERKIFLKEWFGIYKDPGHGQKSPGISNLGRDRKPLVDPNIHKTNPFVALVIHKMPSSSFPPT